MRQFNAPPEWPSPPRADWRPPRRWQPPESWPAAPRRWAFWVDEHGRPVRGPIGRYGGTRRRTALALVVVPVALMTLVLLNPFGHNESTSTVPPYRATVAATAPPTTVAHPTVQRTERPARQEIRTPTPTPTRSSTTTKATPTAATSSTSTPVVTPTPTPTVVVYKNCAEVRAAGKAPLHRGDPGYSEALDHNGDGVACDRGNS
ncbi:excalibur calcium-binding domain-containing protein [Kribbella sp. NPDC004536]|uniref:excalibur calcium-binding domain-containing protein n=1 Tax=Kribbella sp. NPDC004536 TaxID=3364106 RepID=UPI0036A75E8F